jgi:hypothetical protein
MHAAATDETRACGKSSEEREERAGRETESGQALQEWIVLAMTDPGRTSAEVNMDWLLDSIEGRKPMRRAVQSSTAAAPAVAIDSDEALRALMEKIHRTYTLSTDPKRLEIADAIARDLGSGHPMLHRPRMLPRDGQSSSGNG